MGDFKFESSKIHSQVNFFKKLFLLDFHQNK